MKTSRTKKNKTCQACYYVEAWTNRGDEATFHTLTEAMEWLCEMTKDGGEGWMMVHEHEEGEECECVQYLTSHLPVVVDGEEV
jgi:hypothetical protein